VNWIYLPNYHNEPKNNCETWWPQILHGSHQQLLSCAPNKILNTFFILNLNLYMMALKAWKMWSFKSPSFRTSEMIFFFQFFKTCMHTSTLTHFCLSTHDYNFFLSSINIIMIIQLDIKKHKQSIKRKTQPHP